MNESSPPLNIGAVIYYAEFNEYIFLLERLIIDYNIASIVSYYWKCVAISSQAETDDKNICSTMK